MTVNHEQIIEAVKKALQDDSRFVEPSCDEIESQIADFIEAGLSGELTGKPWSESYGRSNSYYFPKYLKEAKALGFDSNLISPQAVRKTLNANKRSTSEKNNRYASIIGFTNFQVLKGRLPKSRLEEIKSLRPKRSTPVKKRFITRVEIDKIIESVQPCPFTSEFSKLLLITAIESADELGIRIGELCAIQINHINFEKQELFIPKAKGNSEFTKGVTDRLKGIWQRYLESRPKTESLNLFVLETGKPLLRDSLIQRFRRVTKKLGFDTSFHAIRRRYISRHLQDGKSLVDVSLAVNHKNYRMTLQYLIPDVQKSIQEQKKW